MLALQEILPKDEFEVSKTPMNAQFGSHDEDVSVFHKPTQTSISVECKLAAKGRFRLHKKRGYEIRVKCMRSRTVGEGIAERMSEILNIPKNIILVHSDQYLPQDFDVVVTSIGNAFYATNSETGLFEWSPNKTGGKFLEMLRGQQNNVDLKDFAFYSLYIAPTRSLAITKENKVKCSRRKCKNPENCGFVPNYPSIWFNLDAGQIQPPWLSIENSANLFRSIVLSKKSPN